MYVKTLKAVDEQGGRILFGGEVIRSEEGGNFVVPTICEFDNAAEITKSESFVPILYATKFKVLTLNNIMICILYSRHLMKRFR